MLTIIETPRATPALKFAVPSRGFARRFICVRFHYETYGPKVEYAVRLQGSSNVEAHPRPAWGCEPSNWLGIFSPAKKPPIVIERLIELFVAAANSPAAARRVYDAGVVKE